MSLRWLALGALVTAAACASGRGSAPESTDPLGNYDPDRATTTGGGAEFASIYTGMGLVAPGPPISFVGRAAYFASGKRDTTLVVVALSIPNHGLTFKHDSSGYLATYVASLTLEGPVLARSIEAHDSLTVRVATFKETSRTDESIIFRRPLSVPPGSYDLTYLVRDVSGQRESSRRVAITVPRMVAGGVSSLEPVYEGVPRTRLDSAPNLLPAPRASYVFGVDDSAAMYVESYDARSPVSLELKNPTGATVWRGTANLAPRSPMLATGIAHFPLLHADIGVLTAIATRAGTPDTSRTSLFLGFGPDLPVLSFNEMLSYLRFFATPNELRALRDAPPAARGDRWSAFLRKTDPVPSTPQNEALDDYFERIRDANAEFRNDVRGGWLSDRGTTYVALGPPSQMYDEYGYMYMTGDYSQPPGARAHLLIWEYDRFPARIVFYDPNDVGQWRLTRPSVALFQSLLGRQLNR